MVMKTITMGLLIIRACGTSILPIDTTSMPMEDNKEYPYDANSHQEITFQKETRLELGPSSYQRDPTNCSQDLIDEAIRWNAECIPRPTAVKVSDTYSSWSRLPSHIMVNSCSGGCRSPKKCLPSSQSMIAIPILTGDCGLSTGQCDKSCSYVNIPIHTKCTCSCQKREEFCPKETHEYSKDTCSCFCPKDKDEVTCTNPGLHWDSKLCKCVNTVINPNSTLKRLNQEGKHDNFYNNRILLLITFATLALALTASLTLLSTKFSTSSTPTSTLSAPSIIGYRRRPRENEHSLARWRSSEPGPLRTSEVYDVMQVPQVPAIRKSSRVGHSIKHYHQSHKHHPLTNHTILNYFRATPDPKTDTILQLGLGKSNNFSQNQVTNTSMTKQTSKIICICQV